METETMEQLLSQIEAKGWHLSSLSHIRAPNVFSAILERNKGTNDGFGVYASSDLMSDPRDALADAWRNANKTLEELNNARRFNKAPMKDQGEARITFDLVEKSPVAPRLTGALSRWIDALDPQEDF